MFKIIIKKIKILAPGFRLVATQASVALWESYQQMQAASTSAFQIGKWKHYKKKGERKKKESKQ